ncbi:MAG: cbb3-type cytochrome c oxidase subunit 3 [Rhodospirillaceae bacterium]|jgi:cytochrome c oxidase cbb3-type subunit IV|nr:cbb3-type cytochrome c oxidase subunit 3 [Rhodospirillaceae bacterium]MBT6119354.1 cbb3-type cytochrome c oxidase subunit 3 [Rhodospirillaceae bacterium]
METIYDFAVRFWGIWLMIVFVGIVAWAYWPGRKGEMEERGKIPFREDDGPNGAGNGVGHGH